MGRKGQSKYGSPEAAAEANRQRALEYYRKNKDYANQKKKEYYQHNRERILLQQKQTRLKNNSQVIIEIVEDSPQVVLEVVENISLNPIIEIINE